MDTILNFLAHGLWSASWWQIVLYILLMTHITILGVTIYLHRSQAHRALDLHPLVSHFFRVWLYLTTGMVTKQWAAIHRKHHAKCETEEDPHSPVTRGIKTVLLQGAELYRAESKNQETIEKYGSGTPDDWIERNIYSRYSWQGVGVLLIIDLLLFGVVGATVWAVQMLWIPVLAAGVVNGLGHYWGYRNYDCPDAATNIFPLGILIGGEELHNNHHTYATSAKLSSKWYEFDIGWMYIRLLEMCHLAKVKKLAPEPQFKEKSMIDLHTLQAVIAHRYDVMANYAKSLKHAWKDEIAHINNKQKFESNFLKSVEKLLQREPTKLQSPQKEQLSTILAHSKVLKTMHDMRIELATLWERSHVTSEQLLDRLQDWCARADASEIKRLRDFSTRLRTYA